MYNFIFNLLKIKYPNARYNKSPHPDIEDDAIELTDNISIQLVSPNEFGVTTLEPFGCEYISRSKLISRFM